MGKQSINQFKTNKGLTGEGNRVIDSASLSTISCNTRHPYLLSITWKNASLIFKKLSMMNFHVCTSKYSIIFWTTWFAFWSIDSFTMFRRENSLRSSCLSTSGNAYTSKWIPSPKQDAPQRSFARLDKNTYWNTCRPYSRSLSRESTVSYPVCPHAQPEPGQRSFQRHLSKATKVTTRNTKYCHLAEKDTWK